MENLSSRGQLIETVVKNYVYPRVFDEVDVDEVKKSLQQELDNNLKFQVTVSNFKMENSFLSGQTFYEVNGRPHVMDITIVSAGQIDNKKFK